MTIYDDDNRFSFHNNFTIFNEDQDFDAVGEYEVDIPYTYAPIYVDEEEMDEAREDRSMFPGQGGPSKHPGGPPKPPGPPPKFQGEGGFPKPSGPPPKFPGQGGFPNFPGNFPPPPAVNIPPQAPPPFIPSKEGFGAANAPIIYAVGPKSIAPCRFKFTYIWQTNGRSYWAYITHVDRYSIAGWRFMFFKWVYFGLDLNRIESFVCY